MKVVFIGINGYEFPYTRVRCYHFAKILKNYGIETEVLSYRDHLAPQYSGIQMLELPDSEKLRLNMKAGWQLIRQRKAIFYIQKVHYHSAMPFFLSRFGKNKFILDYDDWDIDRSPMFRRPYLNRLFFGCDNIQHITGNMASKAVCCVASSKYLHTFLSRYNKKVVYIPTGVNAEVFKKKAFKFDKKVTFIWTGQIWGDVMYNNILELIICFSEVCKNHDNIQFRVIGGGDLMPKVKNLVKNNYSQLDIEIIDWVEYRDMPDYLSAADIGLLPLIPDIKNAIWMRSKSPTKLFEYMATGLPTVSSRAGEAEFIIEDGRDGFLATGREEFIQKMSLLAGDYNLRVKMGELARLKAEKQYSLDVLGKKLADSILRFN
jgi:glycosyltransferase involved in cell wall biosynthesis